MLKISVNSVLSLAGASLIYLFGGWDVALITLCALMAVDYLTGVFVALKEHKISSAVGWHGLLKKVTILLIVMLGTLLDTWLGHGSIVRSLVICFYCSNEGISVLENTGKLGLPYPAKMKAIFEQMSKNGKDDKNDTRGI